jgi:DNA-binding response OmpR family regulator
MDQDAKILIVDDDSRLCKVLDRYLATAGTDKLTFISIHIPLRNSIKQLLPLSKTQMRTV